MPTPRIARIGDGLFFALLGLALLVDLTGGFRIGHDWYRISARDPVHLLIVAAGVTALRHLIVRRPSLRARLAARFAPRGLALISISWRETGIAFIVMTAATAWLLHDQVQMLTGVADRGDPLFSMWRLAWIAHQLAANPTRLFDANIFFDTPGTLAYSDAGLLPGLLAAPFLWAGAPVAIVHGAIYVASFVAAGVTMAWLVKAVTGQLVPALVAGVLFAFLPYRFSTYSHFEMQGIFLMPVALLFLLRTIENGRLRTGCGFGAVVALQGLWSMYLGAYLSVGLAAIAVGAWLCGLFTLRSRARALIAAALVLAAIIVPYLRPYWRAQGVVGDRAIAEVRVGSAVLADYLLINEANVLYGPHSSQHVSAERQLFPGTAPLLLGLVALTPPAGPIVAVCAAALGVAVDASLGVNGLVFTTLYELAPPFRAFRVPARFGMVVGLFLCLLAGIGLARLLNLWRTRAWSRPATVGLVAFALFEVRPTLRLTPVSTTPPAIYAALARDPDAVIVDLPLSQPDAAYWMDPSHLYASTFHWHRLLNGYSGFAPPEYARLQQASRDMPSDDALAIFRGAGARYLVVHEEFYGTDQYRTITTTLDRRADVALVDTVAMPSGESRLYRLL